MQHAADSEAVAVYHGTNAPLGEFAYPDDEFRLKLRDNVAQCAIARIEQRPRFSRRQLVRCEVGP